MNIKERTRTQFRLARVLVHEFKTFLLCATCASLLSMALLWFYYPFEAMSVKKSFIVLAYDVMQITFFQTPLPFVDEWQLIPVFFGLPLLGLVIIAEGAVSMGHLLFQRRIHSKEWQKMLASTYENHIVIAGLGNVGKRVVDTLLRFNEHVICIEQQADSVFVGEMEECGVPVLIGDSRNVQVLQNASITKAKAFLALTDNDLANLESALTVRDLCPGLRIVIRMFDQRLAEKIERAFGINCAFSTSAIAAPVFAQAALSTNILASFEFGGSTVNAFQLQIDAKSPILGFSVDRVREVYEVTVIMHQRNGCVDWNPPPSAVLAEGDKLLVVADNKNIQTFLSCEKSNMCEVPEAV